MSLKQLVLLCGGRTAEHEISLISASSVLRNLDLSRYGLSVIGIRRDGGVYSRQELVNRLKLPPDLPLDYCTGGHWLCLLEQLRPRPDIVFPVLHGPFGEDGTVQGALEVLGLPYVGSGVGASAIAMNKIHCKALLQRTGLPVLPGVEVSQVAWNQSRSDLVRQIEDRLSYPLFVKPANMGSSIGVSKSTGREELIRHVDSALGFDEFVLVEQGIEAREIETSVLGNWVPRVSVAGEVVPSREFYDYEAKYVDEDSRLLIPAPLTQEQMEEVRALALRAYQALQLEGMARVDFLMDRKTDHFWVNEPNTIPGFTQISMYPKLWEASGLAYSRLLDELIDLGLERHQRRLAFRVER